MNGIQDCLKSESVLNANRLIGIEKSKKEKINKKAHENYAIKSEEMKKYRRNLYKILKQNNPEKLKKRTRKHYIDFKTNNPQQYAFSYYKKNAKKRGIEFSITRMEFLKFWQKPCFYCGDKIDTIGIDRINNSVGYNKDNVIPCCIRCNIAKNDDTMEKFLNRCKRIYMKHYNGCYSENYYL